MGKYGRILRYALRQWRTLVLIGVLSCAAAGVAVLTPWPLKVLVDCALGGEAAPGWVRSALGATGLGISGRSLVGFAAVLGVVIFLLGSLVDAGLSFGWTAAGQRMVYDLAGDLFARLQRLSLLFHGRTPVGDSLSRISGDTWCVYTVCEGLLVAPIQQVVTLGLVGAVAWRLDWRLSVLSYVVAPLLGASGYFFGRRLKRQAKVNREAQARLASFVHTTLGAIPLVQAFGAEGRNVEQYGRLSAAAVRSTRQGLVLKQGYALAKTPRRRWGRRSCWGLAGRGCWRGR